jgi:hypothetical protein
MSNIKRRISFTKDLQEQLDLRIHRETDLVLDIDTIDGSPEFDDKYISANELKRYITSLIQSITLKFVTEQVLIDQNDTGVLTFSPKDNVIFTGAVNINMEDGTWDLVECEANNKILTILANEPGKYTNKYATVSYAYYEYL